VRNDNLRRGAGDLKTAHRGQLTGPAAVPADRTCSAQKIGSTSMPRALGVAELPCSASMAAPNPRQTARVGLLLCHGAAAYLLTRSWSGEPNLDELNAGRRCDGLFTVFLCCRCLRH
jgi:hypothetical protein